MLIGIYSEIESKTRSDRKRNTFYRTNLCKTTKSAMLGKYSSYAIVSYIF